MEQYGIEWLEDAYRFIQEDKKEQYELLMVMMPLARTPMDKQGVQGMERLAKSIHDALDAMTPWEQRQRGNRNLSKLRGKIKPGTVVVIPDGDEDLSDPLYQDAQILR